MPLKIDGEMTIYRAVELKGTLLKALEQAPQVLDVDLSEVTEIDTAGIQLLMMIQQTASGRQRSCHWTAPSPVIMNALHTLGLAAFFGMALQGEAASPLKETGHAV